MTAPVGGVAQFTVSPIDSPVAGSLTALGNLNPPGHTLPTDHVYFYQRSLAGPGLPFDGSTRTVRAPARAAVKFVVSGTGGEVSMGFAATSTFVYYLDHLIPRGGLIVGTIVDAGEIVGTATSTLDLGAYDLSQPLPGLASPSRYPEPTRYAVSPWKYFAEPLRSELYAKIYRAPGVTDRDGRIDFDVAGRLVGAWYDTSVPMTTESAGPANWAKALAFVYDYYDPSLVRISIGGTIAPAGVWAIAPDAVRPSDVSTASGQVNYRLFYPDGRPYGLMLVEMTTTTQIRVEVLPGSTAAAASFSGNARVYVR